MFLITLVSMVEIGLIMILYTEYRDQGEWALVVRRVELASAGEWSVTVCWASGETRLQ